MLSQSRLCISSPEHISKSKILGTSLGLGSISWQPYVSREDMFSNHLFSNSCLFVREIQGGLDPWEVKFLL